MGESLRLPPSSGLVRILGEMGRVPEDDQWDTWNMGIGLVVMVADGDTDAAVDAVPGAVPLGRVEKSREGERRIRFA